MSDDAKKILLASHMKDRNFRVNLSSRSLAWAMQIYFSDHFTLELADFHKELIGIAEDPEIRLAVITAFRGSGKTTLVSLSYVIWSVVGVQRQKFVVHISKTQDQARLRAANVRRELEENSILSKDFGPFKGNGEWSDTSLVLPRYGARILFASRGQSLRGITHGRHRPSLIILDDIDDVDSVKSEDVREATSQWFNKDIAPVGDSTTKIVMIGNLLHEESMLVRLKDEINAGNRRGIYREYPLLDDEGLCLWPARYPTPQSLDDLRLSTSYYAYSQEYLLNIVSDESPVIFQSWIHYYETGVPADYGNDANSVRYVIGVDPAIGRSEKCDHTAIVVLKLVGYKDRKVAYVMPNPIDKRMSMLATVDQIKAVVRLLDKPGRVTIHIENVAYQQALVEAALQAGLPAIPFNPGGMNKKDRLIAISQRIEKGTIVFPDFGAEKLIHQTLTFGSGKDDLIDALTAAVLGSDKEQPIGTYGNLPRPEPRDGDTFFNIDNMSY